MAPRTASARGWRWSHRSRATRGIGILLLIATVAAAAWWVAGRLGLAAIAAVHVPLGSGHAITIAGEQVLFRGIAHCRSEEETPRGYSILRTNVLPPLALRWWENFGVPSAPLLFANGRSNVSRMVSRPIDGNNYSFHWSEFTLCIPLRNIVIVLLALAIALTGVPWRVIRPGYCRTCGYDLTGNESGRCPECGTAVPSAVTRAELRSPESGQRA